jgi:hypothetical protein
MRLETEARLLGNNKKWVWLELWTGTAYRSLTMPRSFLPLEMGEVDSILVLEYDSESLHHDGHGYVVDGRIIGKV